MGDLPSATDLTGLATLLAPGLIILGIRARFKGGAKIELKDQIVGYAIASTGYYAAISPLFHVKGGCQLSPWLWGFCQFFLLPCIIGSLAVLIDQKEWIYRLSECVGVRLPHHLPAAWDYAFSRIQAGVYVWIKLSDGTEYAGLMGADSFASSSNAERDLYLEEVWTMNEDEPWTLLEPRRGVLLCGRDIVRIEIFDGS